MYDKAHVSGPSEFGQLPPADRRYWLAWLDGHIERKKEKQDEIEEETS